MSTGHLHLPGKIFKIDIFGIPADKQEIESSDFYVKKFINGCKVFLSNSMNIRKTS